MLSGVAESNQAGPVTVTLASDMGRQTVQGFGPQSPLEFQALATGPYELYSEMPWESESQCSAQAAFTEIMLSRDGNQRLTLLPIRETQFDFTRPCPTRKLVLVWAQRVELAGQSPPVFCR